MPPATTAPGGITHCSLLLPPNCPKATTTRVLLTKGMERVLPVWGRMNRAVQLCFPSLFFPQSLARSRFVLHRWRPCRVQHPLQRAVGARAPSITYRNHPNLSKARMHYFIFSPRISLFSFHKPPAAGSHPGHQGPCSLLKAARPLRRSLSWPPLIRLRAGSWRSRGTPLATGLLPLLDPSPAAVAASGQWLSPHNAPRALVVCT